MSTRLRVGVIGTGFVGPHHVDAAGRTGLADVVALAHRVAQRRSGPLGTALTTSPVELGYDATKLPSTSSNRRFAASPPP